VKNPAPIKARNRNHEHDRKSYVAPPADDIGHTINQNVQTSRAAVVRTLTLERVRNYDLRSTGRCRPRKERGTVSAIASKQVPNTRNARIIRIMEIADSRSTNARRGACPGRMYRESGIINMHILVRKKPRVRASGPLRPTTRGAGPARRTRIRESRPDRRPLPSHRSTVSSNATINIAARYLQKLHAKSAPRRSDATAGPTRPGARSHSGTSRISSRRCTA
jgi:hypothetical protein